MTATPKLPLKAVIFDMDGTLMNSTQVIIETMKETTEKLIGPRGDIQSYKRFVGPPLNASFMELSGRDDEDYIDGIVAAYRKVYQAREGEIQPFDGMVDLLKGLKERGIALAIGTSKLERRAQALLEQRGLDTYFDVVCGALADDMKTASKATIVKRALEGLRAMGAIDDTPDDLRHVVMVGDRVFDMDGAKAHNLAAIGADWAKLAQPGEFDYAYAVIDSPHQMLKLVDEKTPQLMTVGKVGSPHGLHGEVFVYLSTDSPDQRFAPGASMSAVVTKETRTRRAKITATPAIAVDGDDPIELTVSGSRPSHRKTKGEAPSGIFVTFDQANTRDDAEWLRGCRLVIDAHDDEDEPDAFYPHELRGFKVVDTSGHALGIVKDVQFGVAQDLIVVTPADKNIKNDVFVPFVHQIVVEVDTDNGKIVLSPPDGLFNDDALQ